jgi:hypothetical protein
MSSPGHYGISTTQYANVGLDTTHSRWSDRLDLGGLGDGTGARAGAEVSPQEMQLVGDRPLEGGAPIDVEVADRVRAHLGPAGRPEGRILGRLGRGDRVAIGDLHEHRAGQPVGL